MIKNTSILFCIALIVFFLSTEAKADQLAWITKSQAKKASKMLKKQSEVILYCACCSIDDTKEKVKIISVSYRHPVMGGQIYEEYYEVFITANINGEIQEISLDLAYVHIKKGNKAYCVGKELGFKCDPCTEPFDW